MQTQINPHTARGQHPPPDPDTVARWADAERRVISYCIGEAVYDEAARAEHVAQIVAAGIDPDSFYVPAHRVIFDALLAMRDRGEPSSLSAFGAPEHLETVGKVGGYMALAAIADAATTSAHLAADIAVVRDGAARRAIVEAAAEAIEAARDPGREVGEAVSCVVTLGEITAKGGDAGAERPKPIATAMIAQDFGTDLDASIRFARRVRQDLRFTPGLGWLSWDGKRWARDGGELRALELSKLSARDWTQSALSTEGDEARAAALKKALTLEGASHIRAAVDLARSAPELATTAGSLDRDHMLLNVSNGTIDLRTGKLRAHSRQDFITKLAPVTFIEGATHPALDRFLSTLAEQSAELPAFLSRLFGYTLTGETSAEALCLIQGDGGGGKTTLSEAFAALLGDYAAKLPFESFAQSKRGRGPGAASPDLVVLRGARFAFAAEGDQSARLDAGLVKQLTGGEAVTARELYSSPITFAATWKLFLVSNYDPRCDADDSGLWRRLIKVHFPAVPAAKRDPGIKRALTEDPAARSALLWWALQGCLDWQARGGGRGGLALPGDVEEATQAYRNEQDTLGDWWRDLLAAGGELFPNSFTRHADLRAHYDEWCDAEGTPPLGPTRFKDALRRLGLREHRDKAARGWLGIRISNS